MPPKARAGKKSGTSGKSGTRRSDCVRNRIAECQKAKAKRREKAEAAAALVAENESLRARLEKAEHEKKDAEKEKQDAEEANGRLRSQLADAAARIEELERRVDHEFRLRMLSEASRDAQRVRRMLG